MGRPSSQTPQRLPHLLQALGAWPPCASEFPFLLSLTPGGQEAGASSSKGLITAELWAELHELRAQPRSTQSHYGPPFNRLPGGLRWGRVVGGEGEGSEYHPP